MQSRLISDDFHNVKPLGFNREVFLFPYNGRLYFTAETTVGNTELYESDGTAAGTKKISPAIAPILDPYYGSTQFYNYDDALYFKANFTSNGYDMNYIG
ncbi:hypothetical protein [Brumimicrobium salinarum]|uniref:hypothetical protein n=1 Tax=Brumimicrobium salinarum TaxID=2058658 RepID=UPI0013FE41BC|nr:hypothetical protein [Brumimicrobium salinarum]